MYRQYAFSLHVANRFSLVKRDAAYFILDMYTCFVVNFSELALEASFKDISVSAWSGLSHCVFGSVRLAF